jgi:hypothetical protein
MSIDLWVLVSDEELLRDCCYEAGQTLEDYHRHGLFIGHMTEDRLGRFGHNFVMGRKRHLEGWREFPYVHIRTTAAYPNGMILTPYPEYDESYDLGKWSTTHRRKIRRVKLLGDDGNDPIVRFFNTYHSLGRYGEKDRHLLIYCFPGDRSCHV